MALCWLRFLVRVVVRGLCGSLSKMAADVVLSTTAGRENTRCPSAHGFAGSKQLMLGYAHVLAHAGAVMLWDFGGHGANAAQRERFHYSKTLILLMQPHVRS